MTAVDFVVSRGVIVLKKVCIICPGQVIPTVLFRPRGYPE